MSSSSSGIVLEPKEPITLSKTSESDVAVLLVDFDVESISRAFWFADWRFSRNRPTRTPVSLRQRWRVSVLREGDRGRLYGRTVR